MQRVVSIHLNGNVYQLEENGYNALFACLDALDTRLKDHPDRAQLVAGVERAVAEKCQACLTPHRTVITNAEVARIISEIEAAPGQPAPAEPAAAATGPAAQPSAGAAAAAAAADNTSSGKGSGEKAGSGPYYHRRLWQIRQGGMVGGVCLGVATYFRIDVTLVRILFALFVIATGGWGILAYLALMFILPRAASVADAEVPGPQTWPWDDGWPWDKHGWPWEGADWPHDKQEWKADWRARRADWRAQRADWRAQRAEWRAERRAGRMAAGPAPSPFGTIVLVFFGMAAFGWLMFWMRGAFIGGWPLFWGGPFFWGFPHWFGILLFFVFLRFLLWPLWGGRWGWYGHHGYGVYQPYGPWMALWHTIVWVGTIIFLIWLAAQFVPGFHDFLLQLQIGGPRGRFTV